MQAADILQCISGSPCPAQCRGHGFEVKSGGYACLAFAYEFLLHKFVIATCDGCYHQEENDMSYKMLHIFLVYCFTIRIPVQGLPRYMESHPLQFRCYYTW